MLGSFLAVWGKGLSAEQRMDRHRDANHAITITVEGNPSTAFASHELRDGQYIQSRYALV